MANAIVTADDAHRLLRYDPEMGHLYWNPRPPGRGRNRVRFNVPAGSLAPDGYIKLNVGGKIHRAHRVIWLMVKGYWPVDTIDHINRIRSDNRLDNLRAATRSENQQNLPVRSDNQSGTKGVAWQPTMSKWWAYINIHGKRTSLGYFLHAEEASKARKAAELELHSHRDLLTC